MSSKRLFIPLIVASVALIQYAQAHPCEQYDPFPFRCPYGQTGDSILANYNFGDITFVDQYPDPATLTDIEAYMVNGCMQDETHGALESWWRIVMRYVRPYYNQYGVIPAQLTPDEIGDAYYGFGLAEVPPSHLEQIVSPITGDYPRLDCATFSPGNMYIKVLNESEMQQVAAVSEFYQSFWYDGLAKLPPDHEMHNVKLTSPVFYIRIYGYNDVIWNWLHFYFQEE